MTGRGDTPRAWKLYSVTGCDRRTKKRFSLLFPMDEKKRQMSFPSERILSCGIPRESEAETTRDPGKADCAGAVFQPLEDVEVEVEVEVGGVAGEGW
ncbi:hypothetical protein JZ751_000992 [Albula glossodonta]|uniref:Uncharacterized protein n=1 Tax=Albula glossodonta TaxID=121402 RepID=A0A8T2PY02_9TELE|nr:hypothetical protein JZ751_000992 [Albula glossodonta]